MSQAANQSNCQISRGKETTEQQAKEIADNGYLVFMWDKYFATSSHSFCSVTLGALTELWFKCLNIALWLTPPGILAWEEFLPSQEHAELAHSHLSELGSVTFQGGTSDTEWRVKPAAGTGGCAAWALLSCSPWGTRTPWWPQLQVPC